MAFTRSHLFPGRDQVTSLFGRAISHPARIAILRQLYRDRSCSVESLLRNHPLSQSSMSQHLRILRIAGLVTWREEYPFTIYSLHRENFERLKKSLRGFINSF